MPVSVNEQTIHPRKLAAVRREVAAGAVGSAWGPALGKVWDFIRRQPGLRTDGHNIFLYHHPKQPGAPILCDLKIVIPQALCAPRMKEAAVARIPSAYAVPAKPNSRANFPESKRSGESL
jgi:hypothetical protein